MVRRGGHEAPPVQRRDSAVALIEGALVKTFTAIAVLGAIILGGPPAVDDWATSAAAAFLTADERQAWRHLESDAAREAFQRKYWARRDPTPATARNEFKELVEARIRSADAQLQLGKTPGSRTARGLVLVVFGRPSVQQQTMGALKNAPEMTTPGRVSLPNDAFTTTEFHTWVYDRDTRADLLDTLAMPRIEVTFIVEPGRRDELQQPTRVREWQEIVARASIVNGAAPE